MVFIDALYVTIGDDQVTDRPTIEAVEARFVEFDAEWGRRHPAIIRLRRNAWEEFTPFLASPPEVRRVTYSINDVESTRIYRCGGACSRNGGSGVVGQ